MTKPRTASPPSIITAGDEANRYVGALKASLARRWSLKAMSVLYEINDLVSFLYALDRNEEAYALASIVATGVSSPPPLPGGGYNYNVWCPAAHAHAFVAHIRSSQSGDLPRSSRDAIVQDPGIDRSNPTYIADRIADAAEDAENPITPKPTNADRQQTARHLATAVLYSVLAGAGDAAFVAHAHADQLIPPLCSKLGRLLSAGA